MRFAALVGISILLLPSLSIAATLQADEPSAEFGHIDQNNAEINNGTVACGPTSAANSFIYLQNQYGISGLIDPTNPSPTINTLETDMNLDPASGVSPDGFVNGKTKYIADHGLSNRISVESQIGTPTADFLYEQLAKGQDVEIGFLWYNSKTGTYSQAGGHVVTVTGINFDTTSGTGTLDIIDPWGALDISGNLSMSGGSLILDYLGGASGGGAGADGNVKVGDPDNPMDAGSGAIAFAAAESVITPLPASIYGGLVLLGGLGLFLNRKVRAGAIG